MAVGQDIKSAFGFCKGRMTSGCQFAQFVQNQRAEVPWAWLDFWFEDITVNALTADLEDTLTSEAEGGSSEPSKTRPWA